MNTKNNYKQLNRELITQLQSYEKGSEMYNVLLNKIIQTNEPLIYHLAQKYYNRRDYDDILQEMRIAIAKAAESFDTTSNTNFASYAQTKIQFDLWNYNRVLPIVKPNGLALHKLYFAKEELINQGILNPTKQQIIDKAQINVAEEEYTINYYFKNPTIIDLDFDVSNKTKEDDQIPLIERLASDENIAENYKKQESFEQLHLAISYLPKMQREWLKLYYFDALSQTDISNQYSYTQCFISKTITAGIKNLKQLLDEKNFHIIKIYEKLQASTEKQVETIISNLNTNDFLQMVDLTIFTNSGPFSKYKSKKYEYTLNLADINQDNLNQTIKTILKKDNLTTHELEDLKYFKNYFYKLYDSFASEK